MGLDNGFVLRNKNTQTATHLFHFRKYYELAEYFRHFKMLPNTDGTEGESYEYPVTENALVELQRIIEPVYNELIKLPHNTVQYYDENGYPAKYIKLFYNNDFDPTSSQSSFAGAKLIRLYQRIDALLEVLEHWKYSDEEQDAQEIIFYDSF